MAAWLSANLVNIVLVAVLAAVCALVIWGMVRSKKAGKPSCGGCPGCSACAGCSACGGCCPQSGGAGSKAHS